MPLLTLLLTQGCKPCLYSLELHVRIQRGDSGSGPPWRIAKFRVSWPFSSRSLEKITKLPSQIQCWAIIGLPAKLHLNGVSLAGWQWPTFSGIWILSPSLSEKKRKKNVRVGPPLTKPSGSSHVPLRLGTNIQGKANRIYFWTNGKPLYWDFFQ